MKKFLKIVGGLFALIIVAVGLVFFFSADMANEVDSFFNEIKAGRYQQALTHTSKNFQSTVSEEGLKIAFPQTRFTKFSSTSFANREMNADGTGKLSGKVEFSDGSSMAIEVRLIKENDQWKIDHISLPASGITQGEGAKGPTAAVPKETAIDSKAIKKAVSQVMTAFAQGVQSRDFSALYALTADIFKAKYPDSKVFNRSFEKFRKRKINWHAVETMEPVISKTERLEGPVVKVYGYMPTTPEQLGFVLRFISSGDAPRLLGIEVFSTVETDEPKN